MKRILALLLVFATIFAFAACKKTDKDDNGTTTGGSQDAVVDVSADDTSDGSESSLDSTDGTKASTTGTKRHGATGTGRKTNLGNIDVKNDPTQDDTVYKHVYNIKVVNGQDGNPRWITIDGKTYDLSQGNDLSELRKRCNDEYENQLLKQIGKASPEAAAQIGLSILDEGSLLSYKYDPEGVFFYVDDINSWQQMFGFNPLYDFAAGFAVMYYDTVRLYFTYEKQDYMLQLWKGQYGLMFIGSEIGFYEKDPSKPSSSSPALNHYECATDHLLPMEMVCYRTGSSGDLIPLFKRKYERHWWSTGFVPGILKNFRDRSELVMEARVTFDTPEMAKIVGDTFKANKFKEISPSQHNIYNPDTYYVKGCDVVFTWRYIQSKKGVIILKPTTTTTAPSTSAPATESTGA